MFHAFKGCLKVRGGGDKVSVYFPCRYLRRMIVAWMAHNRYFLFKHKKVSLQSKYGVEGGDYCPEPISVKEYLRKMLKRSFWGEDVVLYALSCLFDLKITVVNGSTLDEHLTTCQKEKTKFCKRAGCQKIFATKKALRAHLATHITLKGDAAKCKGCGKDGFTRQKSLDDHYRYCDGNPDRVGPFPCPVAGCRRGKDNPFRRTHNLNIHLKDEHGYDPKHM